MANTTPDGAQVADPDAVDEVWCEATDARTREARDKLFGELRMYQNNVINESIRMAHQDLGDHFRDAGEMEEALLHYEKTRDYCTTNEHALEMYMRAMQVAWDMQQHATVLAYTDKAESVLATLAEVDVALPGHTDPWRSALAHGTASGSSAIRALFHAGGGGGGESTSFASARTALDSEKRTSHAHFTARIKAYRALAQWAQCDVRAPLPPVACDAVRAEAYADIVSPSLIAWYALLSALSVAPPEQRKRAESLAGDDEFRACAESDPAPRDALAAYIASDFRKYADYLTQTTLQLDPVLGMRTALLMDAILSQLLACYLSAFRRTSLAALVAAFDAESSAIAARLVEMISRGALAARIDWHAQTIEMASNEERSDVWAQVAHVAALRQRATFVQQVAQAEYVF